MHARSHLRRWLQKQSHEGEQHDGGGGPDVRALCAHDDGRGQRGTQHRAERGIALTPHIALPQGGDGDEQALISQPAGEGYVVAACELRRLEVPLAWGRKRACGVHGVVSLCHFRAPRRRFAQPLHHHVVDGERVQLQVRDQLLPIVREPAEVEAAAQDVHDAHRAPHRAVGGDVDQSGRILQPALVDRVGGENDRVPHHMNHLVVGDVIHLDVCLRRVRTVPKGRHPAGI